MSPARKSPWSQPETVRGFTTAPPNETLLRFVLNERKRIVRPRVLDLGCGAGRNATPIAASGIDVVGLDLSWPMLRAAVDRRSQGAGRLDLAMAPMNRIPARSASFDIVIAHGIWNLARSGDELRQAVAEAARVSRPGAGLFVFTFSRSTLPAAAHPVPGETFVFTQFSGQPQCFLTRAELVEELGAAGFAPDDAVPLTEHNRPRPGQLHTGGPAIHEGTFRRAS